MLLRVHLAFLFSGAVLAAPVLQAHHGTSITYFVDKSITVNGVITEFVYGYPHPQIYFDVKKDDGKVEKWGSEFGPTPLMMRNFKVGWGRDSIKPGDTVTLTCAPHKTPGATACLAREMHINGKLVALTAEQAKQVGAGASR